MEYSIRMLVVIILILIVASVALVLITGWSGSGNDMMKGLQEFFSRILSGKTSPTIPNIK